MKFFIPFFLFAALAPAQLVSVGIKGGVPVTSAVPDSFNNSGLVDTGRWTVGPTIEVHLLYGFSFEADALYRGYRQSSSYVGRETTIQEGPNVVQFIPAIYSASVSNTKAWDFPLLMKYRFGKKNIRPFATAGATFSHSSSDVTGTVACLSQTGCDGTPYVSYYNQINHSSFSKNAWGPTGGLGVEFKIGKFKLAPEVRYTHFENPKRNLVTVLVGFTF